MLKIIANFASALLLGYLVTELSARFFAERAAVRGRRAYARVACGAPRDGDLT